MLPWDESRRGSESGRNGRKKFHWIRAKASEILNLYQRASQANPFIKMCAIYCGV